jgi:hypothetical protein
MYGNAMISLCRVQFYSLYLYFEQTHLNVTFHYNSCSPLNSISINSARILTSYILFFFFGSDMALTGLSPESVNGVRAPDYP